MDLGRLRQLVHEVAEITGTAEPELLSGDAPVLAETALRPSDGPTFYLVGLIGGKNVGKSELVNAIVGRRIAASASHGPGTQGVTAYAHVDQAERLRGLLESEVPGRYEIITHTEPAIRHQVLLDLPDIDSHHASHAEITRRMLRHMLYPVWIQSVEKYADRKPRDLLLRVTEGNDPRNFLFCLNKVDQVIEREGPAAAEELRDEFARRLGATLAIEPPKVWMISAVHPDRYELPALRARLARDKTAETLGQSRALAARQTAASLLTWLEQRQLDRRRDELTRLEMLAGEETAARIAAPLIERITGKLLEDASFRSALTDGILQERVRRWPIVNVLHAVLEPLAWLAGRRWFAAEPRGPVDADAYIRRFIAGEGRSAASLVQATFAELQQSNPAISRLYADRKLWETAQAEQAAEDLVARLADTLDQRSRALRSTLAGGGGMLGGAVRVIVTVGAVAWFPFVQPVLEAYLSEGALRNLALLLVRVLGVPYLLKSVAFLAVYFAGLWLVIRYDTHRQVDRALDRWGAADAADSTRSLSRQILDWLDGLLAPVHRVRERLDAIAGEAAAARAELAASGPTHPEGVAA